MAIDAVGPAGCRRFGLSDGMIVVAGAALALAGGIHLWVLMGRTFLSFCRLASAHRGDLPGFPSTFWAATHDDLRNTIWYGWQGGINLMLGFTPAWVVLRLRRPRPPWRDLLRQPGSVAALAMVLGCFFGTGALVTFLPERFDGGNAMPSAVGGSTAFAWAALAASGRWKAEAGWVDRSGRLLGCLAIGLMALRFAIFRI